MESSSMAFAIIFTIIIISFVLVFGFQQITAWLQLQGEANILKNIKAIESTANSVYEMSEGSSRYYTVRDMSDQASVCIVDPENPIARVYERGLTQQNWNPTSLAIIRSMIKNNGYNVFYYTATDGAPNGYKIEVSGGKILPATIGGKTGNFCLKNGMKVMFTNRGLTVEAKPVSG